MRPGSTDTAALRQSVGAPVALWSRNGSGFTSRFPRHAGLPCRNGGNRGLEALKIQLLVSEPPVAVLDMIILVDTWSGKTWKLACRVQ
jgi:hypothetical protein